MTANWIVQIVNWYSIGIENFHWILTMTTETSDTSTQQFVKYISIEIWLEIKFEQILRRYSNVDYEKIFCVLSWNKTNQVEISSNYQNYQKKYAKLAKIGCTGKN